MIAKGYYITTANRPKQARSQRYLERVVDAAIEVIDENGVEALTMTGLAEAADLSIGGIYRYFTTKLELLRFLKDYFLSQFEVEAKKAFQTETESLADVVDILMDLHISRMESKENFWRFIFNPPDDDPVMVERCRNAIHEIERLFIDAGLRHRNKIKRKNPEALLKNAYHFAFSILSLRLRDATASSPFAWRNLRIEGARAIIAYVQMSDVSAKRG